MRGTSNANRLKLNFILFFVLIMTTLFTVVVITTIQQLGDATNLVCNSVAIPIAERAAAMVDGDNFEQLCRTLDATDPFYEETRLKLLALKEESGCTYLYTMDRSANNKSVYRFIIDGSAPPGDPGFAYLGSEEDVSKYDRRLLRIWETQIPQFAVGSIAQWGSLMVAWVPLFNSNGKPVGIIGVDFQADRYLYVQYLRLFALIGMALLATVLSVALFISIYKSLTRQNQELMDAKTKTDIAARSIASLFDEVDKQNLILLELKHQADAASEAKSSFIASTSHEIRTPMNAVLGMSELALRETNVAQKDEYVREIKQAGHNLLSIINDILDFSKIESGKLDIVDHEYALSSLLGDCTSIIRPRLGEKGLRFVTDFDHDLPNRLWGDEARVRQVTLNLLSNAAKYTPRGTVTFGVSGQKLPDERIDLFIRVSDTGIGIKPEDLPKLFGEFNRFDGAKNRGIEGTGLGLVISRNLCLLMGGDITVESEYGTGSTFTVHIPQTVIDPSPFSIEERRHSDILFAARFAAPDARVLVVDDLSTNLTVASGLITPYQIEIDTALSGEEALRLMKDEQYDIVLMDHMMPGMDGIETAARIRALEGEKYKNTPIVALTANAVSGMKEMFLREGFNDYLSKPVDVIKLDEILTRWIPEEKQQKRAAAPDKPPAETPAETPAAAGITAIPGVDAAKGILFTGGTEEGYREVLEVFGQDAEERVVSLRDFLDAPVSAEKLSAERLSAFTTQIHALKGALAIVGAAEASAEAARLEAAGKGGDSDAVRQGLPPFIERLSALTKAIKEALA
jgi:signal transduction histidine kinase/FixJ family two-component response regulator/HPt (histidine-containing phosphotransfer) domain-containing protein